MMLCNTWYANILCYQLPDAYAQVRGDNLHRNLWGMVNFYIVPGGTLVIAEFTELPKGNGMCDGKVLGFHIHEGTNCSGKPGNPFADAGGHYNPYECSHPHHAGDLPPLFSCNGYAFMAFTTNRFPVKDIIGRTVIVHENPDDFTTQPSGNAGPMIACGKIIPIDKKK